MTGMKTGTIFKSFEGEGCHILPLFIVICVAVYSKSCHHARDPCKLGIIETAMHLALLIEVYKIKKGGTGICVWQTLNFWPTGGFYRCQNRNNYKFI